MPASALTAHLGKRCSVDACLCTAHPPGQALLSGCLPSRQPYSSTGAHCCSAFTQAGMKRHPHLSTCANYMRGKRWHAGIGSVRAAICTLRQATPAFLQVHGVDARVSRLEEPACSCLEAAGDHPTRPTARQRSRASAPQRRQLHLSRGHQPDYAAAVCRYALGPTAPCPTTQPHVRHHSPKSDLAAPSQTT
jgi:hypothetical protein